MTLEKNQDLREKAEKIARKKAAQSPENFATLSVEKMKQTLHELSVYQVELEMQNEELRRTHTEIEAARIRYSDLYNLAPLGYITLNEAGIVLEANLTSKILLGVAEDNLVNKQINSFVFSEDQDTFYLNCKKLFKTTLEKSEQTVKPQTCELRMLRQDGTLFWAHLEGVIGRNSEGAPVCLLELSDISKRKQAEEEHEKLQAQLSQAQKMEAIGLLAGGVAHDYNNMLSVIIGYSELALQKKNIDQALRSYLEEILKAAMRSAAVTRQLLTYARKQIIAPVSLNLNQTVESMLKMLRQLIGENINLAWLPEPGPCQVKMDPIQIDQILANLCVNARDAIADIGKITITTKSVVLNKSGLPDLDNLVEGNYVVLTVSDNGCGMEKHVLDHIFEPFFTTKGVGQGTGLGLSMVDGIIKQNHGFINVASEPGKGTTFSLYLPCYTDKIVDTSSEPAATTSPDYGKTVLLVEDEPSLLTMSKMMLERFGYRVLSAVTPGEAIELAEKHTSEIGILITDIIMPDMNGKQLAKHLRSLCPSLKVLFMSGYTANVMAEKGLLDSSVHFIQKPFSMQNLADKVREAQNNA